MVRPASGLCCVIVAAGLLSPAPAIADDLPVKVAPCLTSLPAGDRDPQPRDARLQLAGATSVNAQVCIVSNLPRLADLSVNFGVFTKEGNLIGLDGKAMGPQNPSKMASRALPRLTVGVAAGITIPPTAPADLLPVVLVQIRWTPCTNSPPAQCNPGVGTTTTYLRRADISTSVAGQTSSGP